MRIMKLTAECKRNLATSSLTFRKNMQDPYYYRDSCKSARK